MFDRICMHREPSYRTRSISTSRQRWPTSLSPRRSPSTKKTFPRVGNKFRRWPFLLPPSSSSVSSRTTAMSRCGISVHCTRQSWLNGRTRPVWCACQHVSFGFQRYSPNIFGVVFIQSFWRLFWMADVLDILFHSTHKIKMFFYMTADVTVFLFEK